MARERVARKREQTDRQDAHPGCCPPRALVWIDAVTSFVAVPNRLVDARHFAVDAGVAQTNAPTAQVQDSASDSKLDTSVTQEQGKVYRTDRYTVHWRAEGQCRPLRVRLRLDGEVAFDGGCLPDDGQMTLSRSYLLEPPAYAPPGPGFENATVEVEDCAGQREACSTRVPRP